MKSPNLSGSPATSLVTFAGGATIEVLEEMHAVTVDGVVAPTSAGPPVLVGGRYLLGPLLGRGGAAEVFQAHDQVVDRSVAVKIFLPGVVATDPRRQHREISTLAGFSHPGLVLVYDAGETGGRAFFVMQLVSGRTLAERLHEGPIPAAQTTELGIVLADTLAYVHNHGVVHRDVKPANVLLDQHEHPHLSDFGIATVIDSTQITSTGMMIGTAAYLAPEQVRGHPVGTSTDVYTLGLLLLECLTGRREYPGTPMETALARLHRPPEIPAELAAPLSDLLVAMTADDPTERPTAANVVDWLQHGAPSTARTAAIGALPPPLPIEPAAGATPAPAPWWGRHRRALLVGVVLLAIALGSLLSLTLLTHPRTAPAPTAPVPGRTLPPTPTPTLDTSPMAITPTAESPPTSGRTAEQAAPLGPPASTSQVMIPTAPAAVGTPVPSRPAVQPSAPLTSASPLPSTPPAPSPSAANTTTPNPQPTPPNPSAVTTTPSPQPTTPRTTTAPGNSPTASGPTPVH